MLKKRLGSEAIERKKFNYFKISSTLIIPEGCEKIELEAFYYWTSLKKVVIPESVKSIGAYAFTGCYNATIILRKPKLRFDYIGCGAFIGCKDVKEEIRE